MSVRPDLQAFTRFEVDFIEIFGEREKSTDRLYEIYWEKALASDESTFCYENRYGEVARFTFSISEKESDYDTMLVPFLEYDGVEI